MTLSEERPHQSNQFTSCGSAIKPKEAERKEIECLTEDWLKRNKLKSVPFDPVASTYHGAPENALGIDLGAHRKKGKENAMIANRHHDKDDDIDYSDFI